MNLIFNATKIPSALMYAALNEQDFLCRVFGDCVSGPLLDREVDNMIESRGPLENKLFRYARYNAELTREGLAALGCGDIEPTSVQKLDSIDALDGLQRIGQTVAAQRVKAEHFNLGVFKPSLARGSRRKTRAKAASVVPTEKQQEADWFWDER